MTFSDVTPQIGQFVLEKHLRPPVRQPVPSFCFKIWLTRFDLHAKAAVFGRYALIGSSIVFGSAARTLTELLFLLIENRS